jgi:hypothetical protein
MDRKSRTDPTCPIQGWMSNLSGKRYDIPMKHPVTLTLAFLLAILAMGPAWAHRPYFSDVGKIRLPDGTLGEARLLNGDGIFGPDPVRVLILDAQNRLLARSHKSVLMALSCEQDGRCLIFDLSRRKVLDLEPSSFRQGAVVPGADDRDSLWDLEDGEEIWGFAPRNPTPGERLKSYGLLWQKSLPAIVIDGLVGIACALTALAMLHLGRAKLTRTVEKAAAILAILGLIGGGLFLVLISGFFSYLGGLSIAMWLLSLGLGAGAVLLGSKAAGALRGPAEAGTN